MRVCHSAVDQSQPNRHEAFPKHQNNIGEMLRVRLEGDLGASSEAVKISKTSGTDKSGSG